MVVTRTWRHCKWGKEYYSYNYSQTAVFTVLNSHFRLSDPLIFQS